MCFLLLALRAMAATVPSVIGSDALPEGYTEGPIVWSGFDEYLSGLQGFNVSDKDVENLQLNGTVQVSHTGYSHRGTKLSNMVYQS